MAGWKPSGSPAARAAVPAPPPPSGPVRPPTVARERKPALAALALLLIAVGVLASVYLQMQAGNRVGVIELTNSVQQGQQIQASDITEIMVAKDSSINYVTWSERGLLTKYTAQTTLVRGTILIGPMLTTSPTANGDTTTIAVALKSGQFPPTVSQGSRVNAYYVGSAQGLPAGSAGASSTATGAAAANSNTDVSALLSSTVTIIGMPSSGGGAFSGNSSSSAQVFTVTVDKGSVGALLTASAEGDLVFTSGAGS
jgi:hypothetical protein